MAASNELEFQYRFSRKHSIPPETFYNIWKDILEGGHDPNEEWDFAHEPRRTSPLFSAVLYQELQLIELLSKHGARLEDHNREGRTVLQEAVVCGHEDVMQLLLDRGAKIDRRIESDSLRGGTALHLAVIEGLVDFVRTLLSYGADARAKTEVGWSPVDIAVLDHQTTVLESLLTKVSLISLGGQALDVEVHPGKDLKGDEDRAAAASYILEHGVRGTVVGHALLFQGCLSRAIKDLTFSDTDTTELSNTLIRNVEALLRKEAGVLVDIAWPRNLCDLCKRFENQDSFSFTKTFDHQQDLASLETSGNNGCNLCQFFLEALNNHWCLLHQIDREYLAEFGVNTRVRLKIGGKDGNASGTGGYRLIVVCGDKIAFMDLDRVQKHLNFAVANTGPSDVESTASDRSLAVANAWLQRCEDEHPSCRRSELGRLPTRVIKVGRASNDPRVYISAREQVPYTALSYCWGGEENIRLLSTNIGEYTEHLPLEILPQTIADAIELTRRMNIQYLWVDALCILQDSEADLEKELSYMGDIFANTWFTIAAKDSPSCSSGLFHQRNWPTSAIVPTEIRMPSKTLQREGGIHGRSINTRSSCYNRMMGLPRHYKFPERDTSVLQTRGWTLQEELLSRRVLYCGTRELSWSCLEGSCSERQPEERDARSERKWQHVIKRALVTGFTGYGNLNSVGKEEIFNYWLDTVEDFLQRTLSVSRDKLAAVDGVQGAIGKLLEEFPVAGIWSGRFFAPSLLWRIMVEQERVTIGSFPSPSWSWASAPRAVKYTKHPSGTDDSRPWVWHHEVKYYPEAVSVHVDGRGRPGIDEYVTVRCKLLREADLACERHFVKDFLNAPPKSQTGKEAVHFETHHDFEGAAAISDSWLMLVRTNQFIPGTKDRGRKYDIETQLLRLERISADRLDFRRVGLVVVRSWANRWLGSATEEIIQLFEVEPYEPLSDMAQENEATSR